MSTKRAAWLTTAVKFTVPGIPRPKGSTVSFMASNSDKVITKQDSKHLAQWVKDCRWLARLAGVRQAPANAAVILTCDYVLKPSKHAKTREDALTRPDTDKLLRATLDALTGVAYPDDQQVVRISASKRYGETPRTEITIEHREAV